MRDSYDVPFEEIEEEIFIAAKKKVEEMKIILPLKNPIDLMVILTSINMLLLDILSMQQFEDEDRTYKYLEDMKCMLITAYRENRGILSSSEEK